MDGDVHLEPVGIAMECTGRQILRGLGQQVLEHFVYIADAMNHMGHDRNRAVERRGRSSTTSSLANGDHFLKVRSMVGLIPLSLCNSEPELMERLRIQTAPGMFVEHRLT